MTLQRKVVSLVGLAPRRSSLAPVQSKHSSSCRRFRTPALSSRPNAIRQAIAHASIPERTLKRRFKAATGTTLIEYLQNLRIEEARRLLEAGQMPVDDISIEVSYEDPSFFRRLFKRLTGLTPSQYRKMFHPVINAN